MGHQVDLVEQHHIHRTEHHRVFQRLVLALGHRVDHCLGVFADVELGRAHQVSDILDDDEIQLGKVQTLQCPVDHGRVQMTFATETVVGVQQRDLRAPAAEFGGVEIGGDIALDDSDAEFAGQLVEGGRQHGGLTRSR